MQQTTMKLFGHPDSAHAFKVKFYLEYLGIAHDYETIDIYANPSNRNSEFLQASRFAEVPTLIDGDNKLTQSNAILMYLADNYSNHYCDNRQAFAIEQDRQTCLEWLVWEANRIGMCLPQLRCHDHLSAQQPKFRLEQGAYDWLLARSKHDVTVLDKEFANNDFILGDTVSPADFALSAFLLYAYEYTDEVDISIPDTVTYWLNRMQQLSGYQEPYKLLQ